MALISLAICLVLVAPVAVAQDDSPKKPSEPTEPKDKDEDKDDDGEDADKAKPKGKPSAKDKDKKSKIKPYDEVITDEAISDVGLFRTHRVKDKLYFEIPPSALNAEMVWVAQIEQTTAGNSYAGMPINDWVVRWEHVGDRVLLRKVIYDIRADTDDPIAKAVTASNIAPIIRSFDVNAYGTDKAPVIDVTELFTKDVPEFSARRSLNAGSMDSKRSFVESSKSFPTNVETRITATYAPGKRPTIPGAPRRPGADIPSSSGMTAVLHHSMVLLPDVPMKPRVWDPRVGFFTVRFIDFANNKNHEAENVRYIARWRLEKKNPKKKMSEPVKPIVFYVGAGTPEKWKSYVKAGIDMWQSAFEAAGFKNAIVGMYPPDPSVDPDWDPEDARISTIRWLPSPIENAFGPHVSDPRSGEILEADVRMYHNVQKLLRDWYFVQAAASDPRVQNLPMPDEVMGELIQFVVAHEVGHSLGFPHNMKASSSYTVAQLRDPVWTKENGTAPSIMDYARFNYVAQPGDGAALMPGIGAYDRFAAEWGYREFSDDEAEEAGLAALLAKQVDEPMFRFGNPNPAVDSTQQTEDLGSDAVAATELGLKNLERIAAMLVDATTNEGDDYDMLTNMYGELLGQWMREMGHVANVVGGVRQDNLYYGDADQRFTPNDAAYQRRAVEFLLKNAMTTPQLFLDDDIVMRVTGQGVAAQLQAAHSRLLRQLVSSARINRMTEHSQTGDDVYTPLNLLDDLRGGLFAEVAAGEAVDFYRRNVQRSYVDRLGSFLVKPSAGSDLPALARAELITIAKMAATAASTDTMTQAHLMDLSARAENWLDNDGDDGGSPAGRGFGLDPLDEEESRIKGCWER
jgi:hypothetical protein